jgi:hypothetical protein
MQILSFQSFSLFANGGGSRILRRLYKGREKSIYSLVIEAGYYQSVTGNISEKIIPAIPLRRSWMKWRSRDVATWLREKPFRQYTMNRICEEANSIACDIIHVMSCGPWSTALCDDPFLSKKPLWVSFHDHFATTQCPFKDANELWNRADRRLVISEELGTEYQRLFGYKSYEIITDGVSREENSLPVETKKSPVIIYFAGLLHIEYLPLFRTLADTLDLLSKQGFKFKIILRGTQRLNFMRNRSFDIKYQPIILDDMELKQDLDSASILYLPIKFVTPDFYLYSLSTKMVGYLGASSSILYHGPGDSAACHLLQESESAVCCTSLNIHDLAKSIVYLIDGEAKVSAKAKTLAHNRFNLKLIQERFWQDNQNPDILNQKIISGD